MITVNELTAQLRGGYAPGVPNEIEVPTTTLDSLLADAARFYPNNVALDFFARETTYRQLNDQVNQAAAALHAAGVKPGDVVALVLPNCPQHVVAFYAVLRLGAVVAEHNPLAAAPELAAQFAGHGAKVAVVWEKSVASLAQLKSDVQIFAVNLTAGLPRKARFLLSLPVALARKQRAEMRAKVPAYTRSWEREVARAVPIARQRHERTSSDTAVLLHTGGTTGSPKAVELTHANLGANAAQAVAWVPPLRTGVEVFYAVLPFFHAFGLTLCLLSAVRLAATIVIFPKFREDLILDAMEQRPVTFFGGVPPMFERLTRAAKARGTDMSSAKYSISGAMSLPAKIAQDWEELTGGYLVEGYGMTEASPIILGNPLSPRRKAGTLGMPFPSTEIRIVFPDTNTDVPQGEVGELIVRGPQVFAGYLNNPIESTEALRDGWLRTGDLVCVKDGYVTMADRRKELIISGGFNIYPTQVEDALRSMPEVADVAVVGVPGGSRGESVVAALVLEAGAKVDLEQVRTWAEKSISHYALPRQIALLTELPRSQLGKILRRKVRDQLLAAGEQANVMRHALVEQVGQVAEQVGDIVSEQVEQVAEQALEKVAERRAKANAEENAAKPTREVEKKSATDS